MIEHIDGTILKKYDSTLVVNVGGVGYGVEIAEKHLGEFGGEGDQVSLWVFTKVREDEIKLFGFPTFSLREAFSILIQVSGVGPKAGLSILSEMSVEALCQFIRQRDTSGLERVHGIGKRTAEKILLELQTKQERLLTLTANGSEEFCFGVKGAPKTGMDLFAPTIQNDLRSALLNLGLTERDWKFALKRAQDTFQGTEFTELVRFSLKAISESKVGYDKKVENTKPPAAGHQLDRLF